MKILKEDKRERMCEGERKGEFCILTLPSTTFCHQISPIVLTSSLLS